MASLSVIIEVFCSSTGKFEWCAECNKATRTCYVCHLCTTDVLAKLLFRWFSYCSKLCNCTQIENFYFKWVSGHWVWKWVHVCIPWGLPYRHRLAVTINGNFWQCTVAKMRCKDIMKCWGLEVTRPSYYVWVLLAKSTGGSALSLSACASLSAGGCFLDHPTFCLTHSTIFFPRIPVMWLKRWRSPLCWHG